VHDDRQAAAPGRIGALAPGCIEEPAVRFAVGKLQTLCRGANTVAAAEQLARDPVRKLQFQQVVNEQHTDIEGIQHGESDVEILRRAFEAAVNPHRALDMRQPGLETPAIALRERAVARPAHECHVQQPLLPQSSGNRQGILDAGGRADFQVHGRGMPYIVADQHPAMHSTAVDKGANVLRRKLAVCRMSPIFQPQRTARIVVHRQFEVPRAQRFDDFGCESHKAMERGSHGAMIDEHDLAGECLELPGERSQEAGPAAGVSGGVEQQSRQPEEAGVSPGEVRSVVDGKVLRHPLPPPRLPLQV